MHDWQAKFSDLRNQFIQRTDERLMALSTLIDNLPYRPGDTLLIKEVRQQFHWFAGSGGVYGFEQVSKFGQHGEEICDFLLRDMIPASKIDCEKMQRMVQLIRQSISGSEVVQEEQGGFTGTSSYAPDKGQTTVLLADNNSAGLGSLTGALEKRELAIQHVMTAKKANELLMQHLPDAIVISIPLVDCPGYELAQLVRSLPGGDKVPIIIISKQVAFLDKVQAIRSGADAFFEQPIDEEEISEKIKQLLDRDRPETYKVLSVEDDPDQAAFIKLTLESAGYKVTSLQDPALFEEVFLQFDPDLLLLDVMLGSMTGFDLAKYVRQKDRYVTLPVVFLTTENALDMHIYSARIGGDDHLIKPIAPQLLIASVAGRLERARILKKLIERDGLTSCLTHSAFMCRALKIAEPDSHRFSLTLLLLDIDGMGMLNDKFGYAAGDKVIASVGPLLQRSFRNASAIGRVGGNRFALILENLDDFQVERLVTQTIKEFNQIEHATPSGNFGATLSGGLATHDHSMDLKSWFAQAELSLKEAKATGGNRIIIGSQARDRGQSFR